MLGKLIETIILKNDTESEIKKAIIKLASNYKVLLHEESIQLDYRGLSEPCVRFETNEFIVYIPHNPDSVMRIQNKNTDRYDWDRLTSFDAFLTELVQML